tara:strand:- start:2982 stop:3884 length:903 start_codon:yes stop_codon:yes gene_type:complete
MMRQKISSNGPTLSRFALGHMTVFEDEMGASADRIKEKVDTCLETGITTMDHADIYGNYLAEEAFGKFLKANPSYRDQIEIVTKCGICLLSDERPSHTIKHYRYDKTHIKASVEKSLTNLATENIDLLLFHRPSPMLDPLILSQACEELKAEGKVNFFGVSNFTSSQFNMLSKFVDLHTNQIQASPLYLDHFLNGEFDLALENQFSPMLWSPLARGRFFKPQTEQESRLVGCLTDLSKKYDCPLDVLIYSWLLSHPSKPHIILGTNKIERIKSSSLALKISWDIQDWFAVWTASIGQEVP